MTRPAKVRQVAIVLKDAGYKFADVECYYSVDLPGDRVLAAAISKAVAAAMGNTDRGAKTRASTANPDEDYYKVIDAAQDIGCPHVLLLESGFHDNAADELFLLKDANLKRLAEVIADTLCNALNIVVQPDSDSVNVAAEVGEIIGAMAAAGVEFDALQWRAFLSGNVTMKTDYKYTLLGRVVACAAKLEERPDFNAAEMRQMFKTILGL